MTAKVPLVTFLVLLSIALLGFLLVSGNKQATVYNSERFYADPIFNPPPDSSLGVDGSLAARAPTDPEKAASGFGSIYASDPNGNESFSKVTAPQQSGPSPTCFPRDRLTADDLLPKDAANSKWAQLNPAGQGDVRDQNFLTAGYHVGVNTTGSSKRNGNLQLRSEPINPQLVVSPWMQSTIEPNLYQRPLEIGGDV